MGIFYSQMYFSVLIKLRLPRYIDNDNKKVEDFMVISRERPYISWWDKESGSKSGQGKFELPTYNKARIRRISREEFVALFYRGSPLALDIFQCASLLILTHPKTKQKVLVCFSRALKWSAYELLRVWGWFSYNRKQATEMCGKFKSFCGRSKHLFEIKCKRHYEI